MSSIGNIVKISGPLVVAEGMRDSNMFDVVRVSDKRLIGEIIEMHGDRASIQVYEETAGLGTGQSVESTGLWTTSEGSAEITLLGALRCLLLKERRSGASLPQ